MSSFNNEYLNFASWYRRYYQSDGDTDYYWTKIDQEFQEIEEELNKVSEGVGYSSNYDNIIKLIDPKIALLKYIELLPYDIFSYVDEPFTLSV